MTKPIKFKERKTLMGRLRELRRILSNPKHWTQGKYAEYTPVVYDGGGTGIYARAKDGNVCALCLEGGTILMDGGHWGPTYDAVLDTVCRENPSLSIPSFNDAPRRQHPEILDMIDRTIKWVKHNGGGRAILHG